MKIYIDQGHNHSNFNTGCAANGLKEQDITFSVGKLLAEKLKACEDVETMLSRPTNETNLGTNNATAISARYSAANNWKADFFISIHVNAGKGTGAETLYYKSDSLFYAEKVQAEYVKHMNIRNRGVKYRNDVAVIRYTKMPAILVELGFIDDPAGEDFIMLKTRHADMAEALYIGLKSALDLKENQVDKTIMLYNGKQIEVERVLIDGYNYVKLRELEKFGLKVDYDEVRRLPVVKNEK